MNILLGISITISLVVAQTFDSKMYLIKRQTILGCFVDIVKVLNDITRTVNVKKKINEIFSRFAIFTARFEKNRKKIRLSADIFRCREENSENKNVIFNACFIIIINAIFTSGKTESIRRCCDGVGEKTDFRAITSSERRRENCVWKIGKFHSFQKRFSFKKENRHVSRIVLNSFACFARKTIFLFGCIRG